VVWPAGPHPPKQPSHRPGSSYSTWLFAQPMRQSRDEPKKRARNDEAAAAKPQQRSRSSLTNTHSRPRATRTPQKSGHSTVCAVFAEPKQPGYTSACPKSPCHTLAQGQTALWHRWAMCSTHMLLGDTIYHFGAVLCATMKALQLPMTHLPNLQLSLAPSGCDQTTPCTHVIAGRSTPPMHTCECRTEVTSGNSTVYWHCPCTVRYEGTCTAPVCQCNAPHNRQQYTQLLLYSTNVALAGHPSPHNISPA
jgi:hypothetical protein